MCLFNFRWIFRCKNIIFSSDWYLKLTRVSNMKVEHAKSYMSVFILLKRKRALLQTKSLKYYWFLKDLRKINKDSKIFVGNQANLKFPLIRQIFQMFLKFLTKRITTLSILFCLSRQGVFFVSIYLRKIYYSFIYSNRSSQIANFINFCDRRWYMLYDKPKSRELWMPSS